MTSNVPSVIMLPQQQPVIGQQKNARNVNFKNNSRNQYAPSRAYGSQYSYQDELALQRAIEQQQKDRKKQKRKSAILTTISVVASLVMIGVFGRMLIKDVKKDQLDKAAEKAAKEIGGKNSNSHEQVGSEFEKVVVQWKDATKTGKTTAPIMSDTTSKPLRETYKTIAANKNLSTKAKEWAGLKEGADIMLEYGYSGTGKTYFAEQFAESTDAIFSMVKYPDLGSPYKDAAATKAANFFREIQRVAEENPERKIVVCVDECDALIGKLQETDSGVAEARKIRAAVLTGLEEVSKNKKCKNVTMFMTTNYHPKNGMVDSTALSRFNRQIEVPLGDKAQNKAMLKLYLEKVKGVPDKFYESAEFNKFVDTATKEGYSNRELSKIAEEATKVFGSTLEGVGDEALAGKPFKVEYLEKAKKQVAPTAAKNTCSTMKAVAKD